MATISILTPTTSCVLQQCRRPPATPAPLLRQRITPRCCHHTTTAGRRSAGSIRAAPAAAPTHHRLTAMGAPVAASQEPGIISCGLDGGLSARARQQLQQQIAQLEAAAVAAHAAAQLANKEQRFDEAKAQYAAMRRLDREALQLTRSLGCQQCAHAAAEDGSSGELEDAPSAAAPDAALYNQLHAPTPWEQIVISPTTTTSSSSTLSIAERARASIVASLTCDAAATGVQWIYDLKHLARLQQQQQQQEEATAASDRPRRGLEFTAPVQSPYLADYRSSQNTPYGHQALLLLRSLQQQGGLHCGAYADVYAAAYLDDDFSGYMNASTTAFLRTFLRGLRPPHTGADDAQADAIARLAPLAALYAGDARLVPLVAAATRVTQAAPSAVAWASVGAAVLERLLLGAGAAAAVQATVQELRQGGRVLVEDAQLAADVAGRLEQCLQLRATPHEAAAQVLGRNCHLPTSAQTPLHVVLHHEWRWEQQQHLDTQDTQQLFVVAVRDALAAGGCCASRSSYVGACMGALLGSAALPSSWLAQYEAASEVEQLASHVSGLRGR